MEACGVGYSRRRRPCYEGVTTDSLMEDYDLVEALECLWHEM